MNWPMWKDKMSFNPFDFSLRDIFKNRVFQTKPHDIDHLKELISIAFEELSKNYDYCV